MLTLGATGPCNAAKVEEGALPVANISQALHRQFQWAGEEREQVNGCRRTSGTASGARNEPNMAWHTSHKYGCRLVAAAMYIPAHEAADTSGSHARLQ